MKKLVVSAALALGVLFVVLSAVALPHQAARRRRICRV